MSLGYVGVWLFLSLRGPRAPVPIHASVLFTPTWVLWTGLSQTTITFLSSPCWAGQLLSNCLQLSCRNHNPSSGSCCHQCQLVILVPGHVLISVNSSITVLPILFPQRYSTKMQLHFNGYTVLFPPRSLLCFLWARSSLARDITHWHCQGSDNMRCVSLRIPFRGMRTRVWVMHNFISPDTGSEEAGTNCTCKLTKECGMAAKS